MKWIYLTIIPLLLVACQKSVHNHQMWKHSDGISVGDILHTPSQVEGDIVYSQREGLPTAKIVKIEWRFFGSDVLTIEDLKTGKQGIYLSEE